MFIRRLGSICLLLFVLGSSCGTLEKSVKVTTGKTKAFKVYKFDFGLARVAEEYIGVTHQDDYDAEKGYGWTVRPQFVRDRGKPNDLYRDLIYSNQPAKFRVALAPGLYKITFVVGDFDYGNHSLKVEIPQAAIDLPLLHPRVGEFLRLSGGIDLNADILELQFDSPRQNWVLNALLIEPVLEMEEVKVTNETFKAPPGWEAIAAWPNPVQPLVKRFRKDRREVNDFQPTGLSKEDYLKVIQGNVDFFKNHQNEKGAIIDPYKKVEYQYATPCFALAAATLVTQADRVDLLEPAAKAMDWAVWTLSRGKAANHHEDFFSPQIAHALPLLRPLVDVERYRRWEEHLRTFDPDAVYRAAPGGGNWNVVALSGEALFYLMDLRDNPDYIERCIAAQGRSFNSPWGLYTEGPMPYDHFPRIWAADMLAKGYRGKQTPLLDEVLDRGALTSLFMQSPTGELPAGGRSAHHQWNEAEQCVTYEIYAAKAKASGDREMAGVFKRAAHLALHSITRWVRPSGELWIVKNRVDPSRFHGYEGYSSHSQYNLLAMAMLSIAYEQAAKTEDIPETPAPADVGGFVFQLPQPFNKVFANARGYYLEIDYGADLNYNATGLIRIHKKGFDPQLGPSDAITRLNTYRLPERPKAIAAIGPAWKNREGKWISLAEFGRSRHHEKFDRTPTVELSNIHASANRVTFQLTYEQDFEGPTRVVEAYTVTPDWAELEVTLEDYDGSMRLIWPVLADNGEESTAVKVEDSKVFVSLAGQTQSYEAIGADQIRVQEEKQGFRNGWARLAFADYFSSGKATLRIQPVMKSK